MLFRDLCISFDEISKSDSRLAKTKIFADVLRKCNVGEARIASYMALGRIVPQYVSTYTGLAKKTVEPVLAALFDKSEAEIRDLAYNLGDLGLVVQKLGVQKLEQPQKNDLSVEDVYKEIEEIAGLSGAGSQEGKAGLLLELLRQLDPISAGYALRVLIGRMRIGMQDMTIVDAISWFLVGNKSLSPEVERAYNVCADIGLIALKAKRGGIDQVRDTHVEIGIPIIPEAAERMSSAEDIVKKLGDCVAQPKIDGFRLQIHVDKNKPKGERVKFFSRNLLDMTLMFPDLLGPIEELGATTFICDGEAVGWDENSAQFYPFQETVKRRRKHNIEGYAEELPLKLFLFDLLYLDGKQIMSEPHWRRRDLLLSLCNESKSKSVSAIEEKKITSAKQLENYFRECISAGLEGVVVKRPDAPYTPGKRNFNWVKFKRSSAGDLNDTLDCVVLGYYRGSGRRSKLGIGAFLAGIYNKELGKFQTIAKVGTGLTDEGWIEFKKKCDELRRRAKPSDVICDKKLYPEVWVDPGIVCEIKADEITTSSVHSAGRGDSDRGYALRFPRFIGYRPDKSPSNATTLHEVSEMYKNQYVH